MIFLDLKLPFPPFLDIFPKHMTRAVRHPLTIKHPSKSPQMRKVCHNFNTFLSLFCQLLLLYNRKQSADYDEVTADVLVAFLQFPINILCLHSVYVPHFLQFSSTPADLPIGITIIVVTLKGEICGRGDLRSHGSVTLGHHWGTGLGFTQLEPF